MKPVDFMNLITSTGAPPFLFAESKSAKKAQNIIKMTQLPVSLPSKMLMSLFFILNQSEAKLSLDRTWSYNLLKQNLPKSATFSDISPIDVGFELFEYAKLPTGFYQSREMTGKAPSCRETTQQAFFKGESLSTSHWNRKEMRPLLTTETSSGTLM